MIKRIFSKLWVFLVVAVMFIVTACFVPSCMAQAQTAQTAQASSGLGDVLSGLFMNYIAPILGFAILALVSLLAKKLTTLMGISLSTKQQEYMAGMADTLVRSAEEMAAKKIADTGNKLVFKGSDKLASVIGGLTAKFPKLSDEDAEKIALAAVNRIPGIGLTGNDAMLTAVPATTLG